MYSVKDVDGKGFGCIANQKIKRGTLIEKEEPALELTEGITITNNLLDAKVRTIQILINNFNKMDKKSQEEYLKLDRQRSHPRPLEACIRKTCSEIYLGDIDIETAVQVYQICATNTFDNAVFLKMSRFNHSCAANAEHFWNKKENVREIRSISNIAEGEEITIRYIGTEVLDTNERRKKLAYYLFHCKCPACNISDEEMIEETKQVKRMSELDDKLDTLYEFEEGFKCLKEICKIEEGLECLKEMYKIAKHLKTLKISTLLAKFVGPGYDAACEGYYGVAALENKKKKFYDNIQNFASVGLQLSTMLYGKENAITMDWQSKKEDPLKHCKKIQEHCERMQMQLQHEFFASLKL